MKNIDLIEKFLSGERTGKASNLLIRTNGKITCLVNYSTKIAVIDASGNLFLNDDYYSQTTSRNQNIIRKSDLKYFSVSEKDLIEVFYGGIAKKAILMQDGKEILKSNLIVA